MRGTWLLPVVSRSHLSFRINFVISALVLVFWVIVLKDPAQTNWLFQRLLFMGGAFGFILAPVIASLGLSHALFGRVRWFVLLAGMAFGGQWMINGDVTVLTVSAIGALATVFATFPRVFGAIALLFAVNSLAGGVWPGLAALLDGVVPFLRLGDPLVEVFLALVLAGLPFVTKAVASRWG